MVYTYLDDLLDVRKGNERIIISKTKKKLVFRLSCVCDRQMYCGNTNAATVVIAIVATATAAAVDNNDSNDTSIISITFDPHRLINKKNSYIFHFDIDK